jgi:hypothetical protein
MLLTTSKLVLVLVTDSNKQEKQESTMRNVTITIKEQQQEQCQQEQDTWGVNDTELAFTDTDVDECVATLDEDYLFCMDVDELIDSVESAIDELHAVADEIDRIKSIPAYRLLNLGE